MSVALRLLLAMGLFGLFTPLPSFAQMIPARLISSIDVEVLNQETVVIGRITKAAPGADGSVDVSIAVEEVLKGKPQVSLQHHQGRGRGSRLSVDEVLRLSQDQALVLVTGNGFTPLDNPRLAIPTVSGKLLSRADEVADYIREVFRSHPGHKVGQSFTIPLPKQLENVTVSGFFDNGMPGPPRGLVVPVDADLEKWAIGAIRSEERSRAFRALRFFKSDQNIAFVGGLLSDSTFDVDPADNNNGIEKREYRVRREAYDLLTEWGVSVVKPVWQEEIPRFETLETFSWQGTDVADRFQKAVALSKNLKRLTFGRERPYPSEAHFARIADIPSLKSLAIHGSDRGDAILRYVSNLSNLEELNLSLSGVSDRGMLSLIALPKLRSVDLGFTRVTDEGLRVLAGIPSLKKVDVGRTPVTPQGIALVRALRPDLEITLNVDCGGGRC